MPPEPKTKKTKKSVGEKRPATKAKSTGKAAAASAKGDEEEEKKYELGRSRFVSVSEFKGRAMISIREYYTADDGELRPGRKGISLSTEQWEKLKEHMSKIDAELEAL